MIPSKLKLSNFTSYGENSPVLDFTPLHMAAISGSNGVGKSSLLDAIIWCIWGTSRAGDSSDELVRLGQINMSVEFSFELDNHPYTIKRSRKLGSSTSLEFKSASHNLTEGTIKATQQKIIDTIHLTFDTFVNSAYIRQGRADEFTTKGPTERKKILTDILGLSQYDILEEKAKEKIKQIEADLKLREYQLLEIEAELAAQEGQAEKQKMVAQKVNQLEGEMKGLQIKLKLLQGERASLFLSKQQADKLHQTYQEAKQELETITSSGKQRKDQIAKLQSEIESLSGVDTELEQLKTIQATLEALSLKKQQNLEKQHQYSEIDGKLQLKKQRQSQVEAEISDTKNKLKDLEKDQAICPTCKQPLDRAQKLEASKELSQKIVALSETFQGIDISAEEAQLKLLEVQLGSLLVDDKQILELKNRLAKLQHLQNQKEQLIQKNSSLESEQKVVTELRELYLNKKTQVEKLEVEVSKAPDLSEQLNSVDQAILKEESQLDALRQEEKSTQSTLGEIKQLINRSEQLQKTKNIKSEEQLKLRAEKSIYEELALAFGKKGIQAMIIETVIPEIEEETNTLLARLTDGRMSVRLETQRQTKTKLAGGEKGLVETLDIIISDEMGERAYELYSGGEAFRVNLSLRLALSKLLTNRAGSKLQFLVIDEGFGTQDSQGLSRVVEALNTIKEDFAKILVITHLDELKEEFDVRVEVSKGPTGSTFEVVGV
ncbi:hypothetical protein A3C32_02215 [Candidatus Daviesbacteria bacterium RIFCSPHIGHO2_02_FULL_41_14]|nr:MAG: hypothetical protein A3C32_02215 [Candidatus Daviesbacteria bacterium RIFCSPHIGHO2_02_FULL_41_14]